MGSTILLSPIGAGTVNLYMHVTETLLVRYFLFDMAFFCYWKY